MRKLVEFSAMGLDVVPWSVPEVGTGVTKSGRTYRRVGRSKKSRLALGRASLADWQAYVASAARAAIAALPAADWPVTGPIRLHIEFHAKTPRGRRHGELWAVDVDWNAEKETWVKHSPRKRPEPDLVNMFKGTEDALEKIIYANDVQTRILSSVTLFGPFAGVRVAVYAIEPGDYPGRGETVR